MFSVIDDDLRVLSRILVTIFMAIALLFMDVARWLRWEMAFLIRTKKDPNTRHRGRQVKNKKLKAKQKFNIKQ